ncbi:MAG: hypothetical protein HUU50_23100 [Candidatus Brocadiae bacterium]|nr:hypothetical protein [Candidatus Brocadiia bacterium]
MEYLQFLNGYESNALYSIHGGIEEENFRRYVVTTEATRHILNEPLVSGISYTSKLRQGVSTALKMLPETNEIRKEDSACAQALVVLRGGISFGLPEAMYQAYHFDQVHVSYVSSQRKKSSQDWQIVQDSYNKFQLTDANAVYIGEIIARGTTIRNTMPKIIQKAQEQKKQITRLVILNIGVKHAEEVAHHFHQVLQSTFSQYKGTIVVYLEGRFSLAKEDSPLAIKVPDTDFLCDSQALLTPEFEIHRFTRKNDLYPFILNPCVVFDGGARSFAPSEHFVDLRHYWSKMLLHAWSGMTMHDALYEREPSEKQGTKIESREQSILSELERCRSEYRKNIESSQYRSSQLLENYILSTLQSIDASMNCHLGDSGPQFIKACEKEQDLFKKGLSDISSAKSAIDSLVNEFLYR